MTAVPLNGRSYTDLLALQSGVVPDHFLNLRLPCRTSVSAHSLPPASLNPGTISINGQREFANSFVLNGSDVEEDVNMGSGHRSQPGFHRGVPHSHQQLRRGIRRVQRRPDQRGHESRAPTPSTAMSSNSCAIRISMPATIFLQRAARSTRTNSAEPSAARSAKTRFSSSPTIREPDRRRESIPARSRFLRCRSHRQSERRGELVRDYRPAELVPTSVSGPTGQPAFAKARLRCHRRRAVLLAGMHQPGAVRSSQRRILRQGAWSAPGANLLKYIPAPNNPNGTFSTSAYNQTLHDDKGAYPAGCHYRAGACCPPTIFWTAGRRTIHIRWRRAARNVPGFNALNSGRAQLLALGDTKTFSSTAVNEFHFSFMRDSTDLGQPVGGVGASLGSQGFVAGPSTPGIVPLSPKTEGVESVDFNNFSIGTNTNELKQVNNTFQWRDNFSKVLRNPHHQVRRRNSITIRSTPIPSRS